MDVHKVVLPLEEPFTKTYLYDAYASSILLAHGNKHMEWFLSNYIQLSANKDIFDDNNVFLEYDGLPSLYSPFIKKQQFFWSHFMNMGFNLHDFICKNLNQNNYFFCQADEYYIPDRLNYKKAHFIHDLLIYGYDENKKLYFTAGYDSGFMYKRGQCTYKEFEEAFLNNTWDKLEAPWTDKIRLYQYDDHAAYRFNLDLVKRSLEDYLSAENIFNKYSRFKERYTSKVFGVGIYKVILDHINIVKYNLESRDKRDDIYLDNRVFRLLLEHKSIMLLRMDYLNHLFNMDDLIYRYKEVNELAEKAHVLAIKFKILQNVPTLKKIEDRIIKMREIEEPVLQELYKRMQ